MKAKYHVKANRKRIMKILMASNRHRNGVTWLKLNAEEANIQLKAVKAIRMAEKCLAN
jgi:Mg-chelatase subunit ChlD